MYLLRVCNSLQHVHNKWVCSGCLLELGGS